MEFNNLEVIDINNRDRNLTNTQLNDYLKKLFDCDKPYFNKYGDELNNETRFLLICRDSSYITDNDFANRIIELIKRHLNSEALNNEFENLLVKINGKCFSSEELIKIKAITFSLLSYYELKTKINTPPGYTSPGLTIQFDDENKFIYHNLTFVENIVESKYYIAFTDHQETIPFEEAIINYNEAIRSNEEYGYNQDAYSVQVLKRGKKDLVKRNKSKIKVPQKQAPTNEKEPMKVIALLHFYNNKFMTLEEANTIAKKYDYNSKESGRKLFQYFSYYSNRTSRMSTNESKRFLKAKIKIFERVIELLTDETAIAKANTELKILEIKYTELN